MRKAIMAAGAPAVWGPYSHAVVANGFVYVSGQGPNHPVTNDIPDAFKTQVRQTIINMRTILQAAGADLQDAVKITVYLSDLTRFSEYNEVFKEFFPSDPPARATVGCHLLGIQVEMDCIAVLPS